MGENIDSDLCELYNRVLILKNQVEGNRRFTTALLGHHSITDGFNFAAAILKIHNRLARTRISLWFVEPGYARAPPSAKYGHTDISVLVLCRQGLPINFVCCIYKHSINRILLFTTREELACNIGYYQRYVMARYNDFAASPLGLIQIVDVAIERHCRAGCCCLPFYALTYALLYANNQERPNVPRLVDSEEFVDELRLKFAKMLLTDTYLAEDFIIE